MPTCGGLFDGAGLLAAGLHRAGWEHSWLCESDPWRRELLRTRFPDAVVYDDVRTVRGPLAADTYGDAVRDESVSVGRGSGSAITGRACEAATNASRSGRGSAERDIRAGQPDIARRVDLIAGGFPCKGASTAGKRNGFDHSETVLWHEMRRVIGEVRPRYVVIENVANILGMAAGAMEPPGSLWGTVVGDLAALGFGDIRWDVLPAAAVRAPHLRERVFAVATYTGRDERRADASQRDLHGPDGTPRGRPKDPSLDGAGGEGVAVAWGEYGPGIRRWEAVHGPAPKPLIRGLDDGGAKVQRMRARLDRQRLSALGDAVHVYVGQIVGEYVMDLERQRLMSEVVALAETP